MGVLQRQTPRSHVGTVVFRVSGIAAGTDGAFYISLFQDPTANAGEAGDGISVWVRTNNNTLLPQNSTNEGIGFSEHAI